MKHFYYFIKSVFLILLISWMTGPAYAQLTLGNVFMRNNTVEVGIGPVGACGSGVVVPTGGPAYHPRSGGWGNILGFVADPVGDGWAVGTPNYVGDYFLPGTPHEGWDIMINGNQWNRAWQNGAGGAFTTGLGALTLTGSNTSFTDVGGVQTGIWQGTMGALSITQTTTLEMGNTYFVIDVVLTNTGTTPITNIFYNRTVDPDNEQTLTGGSFETNNNITFQPTGTGTGEQRGLVRARGLLFPTISYLGLGTRDCRARVYIRTGTLESVRPDLQFGGSGSLIASNATLSADVGIGVVFNLGTLAAGQATRVRYAYILAEEDLASAFAGFSPTWEVDGVPHSNNDTIYTCAGTVFDVEMVNAESLTWGAWLPTTGLAATSGMTNTVTVGTSPIRYRVIGNTGNCQVDTMYLTFIPTEDTFPVNIERCFGETYDFFGTTISSSGTYYHSLTNMYSCDSTIQLNYIQYPDLETNIYDTVCVSELPYYWLGIPVVGFEGEEIVINFDGTASNGCDSNSNLHLYVVPQINSIDNVIICGGELPYVWNGISVSSVGTGVATYTTIAATTGCDSIVSLNLSINPSPTITVIDTICDVDLPYLWNGISVTSGGASAAVFTSLGSSGCDSVTTLNLYIIPSVNSFEDVEICANELPYLWNGISVTTGGTAVATYVSESIVGCDSTVVLNLTVNPNPVVNISETICHGSSFLFDGVALEGSGIYHDTNTSVLGCDSITILSLVVTPLVHDTINITLCSGATYDFHGTTYGSTGLYSYLLDEGTCDTAFVLNLLVNDTIRTNSTETICFGGSLVWGSETYTTAGIYPLPGVNAMGCDTLHTLAVVVTPIVSDTTVASICSGSLYTFFGSDYTTEGFHSFTSTDGDCDTIRVLDLSITDTIRTNHTETICFGGSFVWGTETYTTAGIYPLSGVNAMGCDTLHTLTVVVAPIVSDTTVASICSGSLYTFFGSDYTTEGFHLFTSTDGDCDTLRVLDLSITDTIRTNHTETICFGGSFVWGTETYTTAGIYPLSGVNAMGCDTLHTLTVVVAPIVSDTTVASICSGSLYTFFGSDYTTEGFHLFTSTDGDCDTLRVLDLSITDTIRTNHTETICFGGSFVWGTETYTTAGIYPLSGVNAMGCDTIHTLTIVVAPIVSDTTVASICSGSLYTFFGSDYTTEGFHSFTSTDGDCDTIRVLDLSITDTIRTNSTETICFGGSYVWGTETYTTAGIYPLSGVNEMGCDTIHTLTIVVAPIVSDTTIASICSGSSYTFFGSDYTTEGLHAFTSTDGDCDTLRVLDLSITDTIRTNSTETICFGGSFVWGTETYTTAGIYPLSGVNAMGCDTIHTLTIVVAPIVSDTTVASICSGSLYTFFGSDYTTEGFHSFTSTDGDCDTIRVLDLSITDTIRTNHTETICFGGSFVWGTETYTTAGIYPLSGVNAMGCDTLHTLTVVVAPIVSDTTVASICSGSSYTFFGSDYTTEGFHSFTSTDGDCDTLRVLDLSITDTIRTNHTETICFGGSYVWGTETYTTAGIYPLSGVNAMGCDTIHTLTIVVAPIVSDTTVASICSGSLYTFFGSDYTTEGLHTFTSTDGDCDTLRVLDLSITDTIRTNHTETICFGGSFVWGTETYTTAGIYPLSGVNAMGCDTLHTLTIVVAPIVSDTTVASICSGSLYTFFGSDYTTEGLHTFTSTDGDCDTLRVLDLSITDTIRTNHTETICFGGSYVWGTETYTTDGIYPLSGVNALGCDTLHTLTIIIAPITTDTLNETICAGNSYTFYGADYTVEGTYSFTSTDGACDTLHVLNLTVTDTIRTYHTETICFGGTYVWGGVSYSSVGVYPLHGINALGCDTLHTLTIIVNPIVTDTLTEEICSGSSYTFYGTTYNTEGTHSFMSTAGACDTLHVLILSISDTIRTEEEVTICFGGSVTFGTTTYTEAGIYPMYYTTLLGCDSLHTVTVFVDPLVTDTINEYICPGADFIFYGTTYNSPGTYTYLDVSGDCDTLHVLNLDFNPNYRNVNSIVHCRNELPVTYFGITIPMTASSNALYDSVVFTTIHGCDSIIVLDVLIHDTDRTELDTLLCYGHTMNFGDIVITTSGVYNLILDNVAGCDSFIQLTVDYTDPPIIVDSFITGCGQVTYDGDVYLESISFADTFRNNIGCDSLIRNMNIVVLYQPNDTIYAEMCRGESYDFNGTIYTNDITVTQSYLYHNGCDSTITLILEVHELPNVKLHYQAKDTTSTLCVLDSVKLYGTGAESYMYYNAHNEYLGTGDNIEFVLVHSENWFYVVGFNEYGCTDTSRILITAEACCEALMPTAFSPNGDGLNDRFGPVTDGNPENYMFEVYNRWGERVFISFKVSDKWDGTYQDGKPADIGTYFYKVVGTCYDGKPLRLKGDVTLIR